MRHLLGQDRAVGVLQTQWQAGRLHHAYIFHGPQGVGKFTAAMAFAKLLLCHDPVTDLTGQVGPCDSCDSCRLLRNLESASDADSVAAAHPDLHVIRKELAATSDIAELRRKKQLNIPVDLIREQMVGGQTSDGRWHDAIAWKTPALNHGKVFIVDEAELLGAGAENAMLKTLEEPPADVRIILVTSSEDKLLPTIRSRCQRVAFVPLSDDDVLQWTLRYAQRQGPALQEALVEADTAASEASRKNERESAAKTAEAIRSRIAWLDALPDDEQARQWLLTFAGGSIGRAKLVIDHDLVGWAKTLLPAVDQMAQGRFDTGLGGEMQSMIDGLASAWVEANRNASKEAANRMASRLCWSLLATHARRRLADAAVTVPAGDEAAAEPALEPWLGVIDALDRAAGLLETHVNMGIVCDHLALAMARSLAPLRGRA